jgi:hypothetical protein
MKLPPKRFLIEDFDFLLKSKRMTKVGVLMLPSNPHGEFPLLGPDGEVTTPVTGTANGL